MADPNQKLFSQIADLGRNINSLADAIKKNTSATESFVSAAEKSEKKEKEPATATNKAPTAPPVTQKENEKSDKSIKDLTKVISNLLGENGPLMKKMVGAAVQKSAASKEGEGGNKDFTNIAGGLKGIIKAFQEGGVAKQDGKYLVGENGPEVVKLPKGAGVIPINVKDLMEGLKNVPELADLLKSSKDDSLNFFGSSGNPGLIDSDGMIMNLRRLSTKYEKLGDDAKDDASRESADKMMETIDSLMTLGKEGIDKEVDRINIESQALSSKYKLDRSEIAKRDKLQDEILKNVTKDNDYYNVLAIAKAELLATQSLVNGQSNNKEGEATTKEQASKLDKELSELPDQLGPEVKQQEANLKKSESVVNPSESKEGKKGLFSRFKKEKKSEGEKVESLESLAAKEPVSGNLSEESKEEKKKSALLSKVSKGAENALFSAAGSATGKLGIASPLAKKGLGALKNKIDNRGNAKSIENQTELGKKPALVSDVKKLSVTPKKELGKEPKEPADKRPNEKSSTAPSTSTETSKKEDNKKSENKQSSTSEAGTSKDMQDIKNALSRIAAILEGPLTVSPMESPFRPDSRRI